jgi:hypothetical protein
LKIYDSRNFVSAVTEQVDVAVMIYICIHKFLCFTHDRDCRLPQFEFLWFSSDHLDNSQNSNSNRILPFLSRFFTIHYPSMAPPSDAMRSHYDKLKYSEVTQHTGKTLMRSEWIWWKNDGVWIWQKRAGSNNNALDVGNNHYITFGINHFA